MVVFYQEWVQCNLSKGKKNSVTTPILEGIQFNT